MYIPTNKSVDLTNTFWKNKQKHMQHTFKLEDDTTSIVPMSQGALMNVELLPSDNKKELIAKEIIYLPPE